MIVQQSTTISVTDDAEVVASRQLAKAFAKDVGFGLVDETKLVTAVSELSRNLLVHGGGGAVCLERIESNGRRGVRVTFEDHGPGIADITSAMKDGQSSAKSMGMGLPGSKRLVSEFEIVSQLGVGTRVVIVKWK
jgi:serine/threonine-protein kinase RsbT